MKNRGRFLWCGTAPGVCFSVSAACSLAEARESYDNVIIVTSISTRDYGQPGMQHFEVSSRINERSGMNYN